MTADEAVEVFWRAVEAGHFADLEERLRAHPFGAPHFALDDEFRVRVAELLGLSVDSSWVTGLLAQGWAL